MPTYDFRCWGCGEVEVDIFCSPGDIHERICGGCGGEVRMIPGFQIAKPGPDVWGRTLNEKPVKERKWI